MARLKVFVQAGMHRKTVWKQASATATKLYDHLATPSVEEALSLVNRPRLSSRGIQDALEPFLHVLGFRSEARGLFTDSLAGLRPDFFLPLAGDGVILEVERGKTLDNNADLLDFWKTHICAHANFLFLLVPEGYQSNEAKSPRSLFDRVDLRLSPFFVEGNYTNVRGVWLFGY